MLAVIQHAFVNADHLAFDGMFLDGGHNSVSPRSKASLTQQQLELSLPAGRDRQLMADDSQIHGTHIDILSHVKVRYRSNQRR
jgi:hypothetical protein